MNNEKLNICDEAGEYQSDALELAAQKLPWFGKSGIPLALFISITAIVWASLSKVDIIVEANGKLISSSQNIVMKPLERTVIKKVNVRVGQFVKKIRFLLHLIQRSTERKKNAWTNSSEVLVLSSED